MSKKLAIYVRTSTEKQDTGLEAQLMACKDWCAREGITDYLVFSDADESGKQISRPALDEMLHLVEKGQIHTVLVYCVNRLSRLVIQSHLMIAQFQARGVRLVSCTETVDLDTPEGRLLYGVLALLSQFQREDTVRKVKNGLENAKRKGVKLGRRKTRDDKAIHELLQKGLSVSVIASKLGCSRGAVYRTIRDRKAA